MSLQTASSGASRRSSRFPRPWWARPRWCGGAATNGAETRAAVVIGATLGPFTGPVGSRTIAAQGGGTLVGPAGVTWRESDGSRHALVIGGIDLNTGLRKSGVWGF